MWASAVMSGVLVGNLARKFSWVAFVLDKATAEGKLKARSYVE